MSNKSIAPPNLTSIRKRIIAITVMLQNGTLLPNSAYPLLLLEMEKLKQYEKYINERK